MYIVWLQGNLSICQSDFVIMKIFHYETLVHSVAERALLWLWMFWCRWVMRILVRCHSYLSIGKTPVRIILWCPTTKMLIKACFLIQPLEQKGGCQKCCICLCSKVRINHFYQLKESLECLNILISWSQYWVDRLRRTLRRNISSTDISTSPLYFTPSCPHQLQRS